MVTGLVLMALLAPRSGSPEDRFWKWFSANSPRLLAIRSGDEPVAGELAAELAQVHPDLTWEVGPPAAQRELVISAGGIVGAFPAVKALVAARPSLVGWKVIAFRPRRDPSFSVRLGSYELKPDDVWFAAEADGQKVGLTVYVMGYEEGNLAAQQAVFLLLDNALGEYEVETRVGFIELRPAPIDPRKAGLRPFKDLPSIIGPANE